MKKTLYIIFIVSAVPFMTGANWQSINKVKQANKLFKEDKYTEALAEYNDAQIDTPNSAEIYFNMGDVFYRMKKYSEAVDSYRKAIERGDINLEAKAYYNIGNALFRQGRLKEALDTYKQALELSPDDIDAKYNIEFTERKIKEMLSRSQETMQKAKGEQEKKEKKQQCEVSQEAEEKEGGQMPETEEQRQAEEEKQAVLTSESEGQKDSEAQEEQKKSKDSVQEKDLTKEDAERILTTLEDEERKPSNFGHRQKTSSGYEYGVEKDW